MDATGRATTARDTVLNTPELLEVVISFLPGRDILANAQRVSWTWSNSITRSAEIAKSLWLKNQAIKAASPIGFMSTCTGLQPKPFGSYSTNASKDLPVYPSNTAHNSLPMSKHSERKRKRSWKLISIALSPPRPESRLSLFCCHICLRPSAAQQIWRNMYLTKPAITIARLDIYIPKFSESKSGLFIAANSSRLSSLSVREPDGLTFGLVLAIAEKICQAAPADIYEIEQAYVNVWFATETEEDQENELVTELRRALERVRH
jgi:hypothetical protein